MFRRFLAPTKVTSQMNDCKDQFITLTLLILSIILRGTRETGEHFSYKIFVMRHCMLKSFIAHSITHIKQTQNFNNFDLRPWPLPKYSDSCMRLPVFNLKNPIMYVRVVERTEIINMCYLNPYSETLFLILWTNLHSICKILKGKS